MKKILLILFAFAVTVSNAQEKTFESEVSKISKRIDKITKQQKDSLKQKVKAINLQLDNGEITFDKAQALKKAAAQYHAKRIERLVSVEEKRLQLLVQDKTNGKILGEDRYYEESTFEIGGRTFQLRFTDESDDDRKERIKRRNWRRWRRRTTSQFVFAMGVNNVLENHRFSYINDSPYKFWQSHFYEVGFTWKYRLNKNVSKTYFKYGFSFLWNNLRLDNNQYHVLNANGRQEFATYPYQLDESRLRHVQMTFPMHLEFDLSRDHKGDANNFRDRRNRSWRIGLGGFVGFKMGTRQYLEYTDADGVATESLQKGSFNTNIYNYGLSTYLAYRDMGLYVKYDLNPLFKESEVRNISLGIRFDFD